MAKRKHKFRYHGKCRSCAGPISDWRDRWDLQNSRLETFELKKKLLLPYKWCTTCRPSAVEFIKMHESIERLSAPTQLQSDAHYWNPKKGDTKIVKFLPGKPYAYAIHRSPKAS